MSPLAVIGMLTPILAALGLVLSLLNAIPGASIVVPQIQAAITAITNSIGLLNGLPTIPTA